METQTLEEKKKVVETGCCPIFDPAPWDDKMHKWENKLFIKDQVRTFFYMPCNFGKVMQRLSKATQQAGVDMQEWLCLSDHTSKWNMDVYLEVNKEVPNVPNVKFSGTFYSKVYEGPFKDTGKWATDFQNRLKEKGLKEKKSYMWYTTCPKCAKAYGKNYNVFIAEIE
jgi:hypothetical protein